MPGMSTSTFSLPGPQGPTGPKGEPGESVESGNCLGLKGDRGLPGAPGIPVSIFRGDLAFRCAMNLETPEFKLWDARDLN